MIHMKCEALFFSEKLQKKNLKKMLSAAAVIGTLRVT